VNAKSLLKGYPVATYFVLAFTISWLGAFAVAAPYVTRGTVIPDTAGLLMFPLMLLGPSLASVILTALLTGRSGLRDLFARMTHWNVAPRWYATAVLIPPALILFVLLTLSALVSSVYIPNRFIIGIGFGLFAGYLEEIGWTGFALPRLLSKCNLLAASFILGLIWGLWHAPVVDFLGAAYPHGSDWPVYFLAFVAVVAAMRVLIGWVYSHTHSILLAQIMHASSTGFLVVLSPTRVSPGQEAFWYAIYSVALWVVVALVLSTDRTPARILARAHATFFRR